MDAYYITRTGSFRNLRVSNWRSCSYLKTSGNFFTDKLVAQKVSLVVKELFSSDKSDNPLYDRLLEYLKVGYQCGVITESEFNRLRNLITVITQQGGSYEEIAQRAKTLNSLIEQTTKIIPIDIMNSTMDPSVNVSQVTADTNGPLKATEEHLIGKLEGLPLYLVQSMLYEQFRQTGANDIVIFQENPLATSEEGGFTWDRSELGSHFWHWALCEVKRQSEHKNVGYSGAYFFGDIEKGESLMASLKSRTSCKNTQSLTGGNPNRIYAAKNGGEMFLFNGPEDVLSDANYVCLNERRDLFCLNGNYYEMDKVTAVIASLPHVAKRPQDIVKIKFPECEKEQTN